MRDSEVAPANVCIRSATGADAHAIKDIYAPIVLDTVISFEADPPGVEEIRRRMTAGMPRLPWLVAEITAAGHAHAGGSGGVVPPGHALAGGSGGVVPPGQHRVAGYAYAAPFRSRAAYRWSVETSVYLGEPARGRGIGRRLYEHLLAELCALGYVNAYAGIALPNDASVRLHEAVGFTSIGAFPAAGHKHGRWVDVGWWVRALRQPPGTPAPPRGWEPRS